MSILRPDLARKGRRRHAYIVQLTQSWDMQQTQKSFWISKVHAVSEETGGVSLEADESQAVRVSMGLALTLARKWLPSSHRGLLLVDSTVVSDTRLTMLKNDKLAKDGDHVLELELMGRNGGTWLFLNVQEARALGRGIDDFLLTDVGYPRRT